MFCCLFCFFPIHSFIANFTWKMLLNLFFSLLSNLNLFSYFYLQLVMSSALATLLEAARFIELQEQRERLTSTSSTASSLSTSPHSNTRYQFQSSFASSHQSLVTTPPASPLSDIPRGHIDYISSNGTTIIRNGKCSVNYFHHSFYLHHLNFLRPKHFLIENGFSVKREKKTKITNTLHIQTKRFAMCRSRIAKFCIKTTKTSIYPWYRHLNVTHRFAFSFMFHA